jgi:hypothetical protein
MGSTAVNYMEVAMLFSLLHQRQASSQRPQGDDETEDQRRYIWHRRLRGNPCILIKIKRLCRLSWLHCNCNWKCLDDSFKRQHYRGNHCAWLRSIFIILFNKRYSVKHLSSKHYKSNVHRMSSTWHQFRKQCLSCGGPTIHANVEESLNS